MERLLTLSEVAAQTGIPEGTWRFWKHTGKFTDFVRIGRRLRVKESVIKAWIDGQMDDPAA
jgi:excisionase family DNA binding protein